MKIITTNSKLTIEERETLINISYDKNRKLCAEIDTSIPKYANKCRKQGWEQISETRHTDGSWVAAVFRASASAVTIGKANKAKRKISEEQRMAASERMRTLREKKNNSLASPNNS